MRKRILVIAALALAAGPVAQSQAGTRQAHYKGTTKEGTKISFVVDHGWVDQLETLLPTTCLSVHGGTPQVDLIQWWIPYKFRVGSTSKVAYGDPTRHYSFTARRRGSRLVGKLSMNYSLLGSDAFRGVQDLALPRHGQLRPPAAVALQR